MRVTAVRGLSWMIAAIVVLVVAAVVVAVRGIDVSTQVAGPPVVETADPGAAFAAAKRQHQPVGVTSLYTATRKVSAQPNGTLTAELSAEPMQVERGGGWLPVDAKLAPAKGNVVTPKAVATDLAFSGGGDTPLVRFGTPGRSFTLTWPGKLPKPTLDGDKATYAEVLPGVDLVLGAETSGFTQHLVVKNPGAKVGDIKLGLTTDGLTVKAGDNGVVQAVDAKGGTVFQTPPSTMWDATAARQATVGVRVDQASLTLVPDQSFMADPHARFPIVIDPDWRTFGDGQWTKVFSGSPNSGHWYGGGDVDTWAKVGTCVGWAGCAGVTTARTYWMFDTGFLAGKRVISAEFNATVVYGPSCNTRSYDLFMANAGINPGTTWNNAPSGWAVDTSTAEANYTGCAGYKGLGFDVNKNSGLNTVGWSTYFVEAHDEGDKFAWRKLDGAATRVVVNYNTYPDAPTDLTTQPPLHACKWCGGTPYVGDDSIRLQGRLTDPDNDQVTANWDVYDNGTRNRRAGPKLGSGNVFTTDVDLSGWDGHRINWTMWGDDGWDSGAYRDGPTAFIVDRVGIDKSPGVTGTLYQPDNRWHGGVGVPGSFTFDASGVSDVDHYLYGWSDPPSTPVDADALGGKATVSIAPTVDGPQDLYVQSVDRAGHRSPTAKTHIYVRAGNGPIAQWSFEGNTNDTAFLGDHNGTISGAASYTPGAVGSALSLGVPVGTVTAPTAVRTDSSFTVSAWAKVNKDQGAEAVVSQDADGYAGFDLWYRPENGGKWVFGMYNPTSGVPDMAWSAGVAQFGVWTQLTAVYDAPAKQLRLYVDGVLSGTTARTVNRPFVAGPVGIGRNQWNNATVDYFNGMIDEVKLYDRIVSDTEISSAVSRDNVQVGYWKLDEDKGNTATNAIAGGSAGVLQGGAHFTTNGAVNGAVQLDHSADFVSTAGPAFRTDQSYTVSTWVKADTEPSPGNAVTALSQSGSVNSAFLLGLRNDPAGDMWELYTTSADSVSRPQDAVVQSGHIAKLGEWTQLTAVHDGPNKQLRLYVNGALAGTAPETTSFNATGPLVMGRALWQGAQTNAWPGAIDEVRAYSRVLSDEEIRGIVSQASVTQGNWKLDGNLQDSSTRGLNGTSVPYISYTAGQTSMPDPSDLAARLDGSQIWVDAAHAVDTDRSFSVAVWAKVDSLNAPASVVSEDGNFVSAFKIQARTDHTWAFMTANADTNSTTWDAAAGGNVQIGQWAHLVGVYDATAHQIQLYVNGVLAGSTAHNQKWNPGGHFEIGRALQGSTAVEQFAGAVDDVSVYSRGLFATEIQTMAGRDLTLVHDYPLDEATGHNAADAVGSRNATLTGGAGFADGRVGNAAVFDGTTGAATTTGVDLRVDQAFTVSTWVSVSKQNRKCATGVTCKFDAVSMDGPTGSKFRLGHVVDGDQSPDGAWFFEMPETNGTVTKAAVSVMESELDTWTHLTGVYDPASKKIWLYVNASRVGDGTLNTAWPASGSLAIGRGKVDNANAEFWPGGVDDVRLYTGQLDKDKVKALYFSYPARTASTLPTADAAQWTFDDVTGTTAHDSANRGGDLTLTNAKTIGGRKGGALEFATANSFAQTAGPVVDTARSFSIATWVYLYQAGAQNLTVVAQDGNRLSPFLLSYYGYTGKWAVIMPTADQDNPTNQVVILNSTEPARTGEWTHLAMSYDAGLHQIRLYVNGILSGAQVGVSILPAPGPMTVSRGKWNGGNASPFNGVIDDVRVFTKAISDGEARKIHEDVYAADQHYFRFDDGTAKDTSGWQHDGALAGGTSFVPGVGGGQALKLDGASGMLTSPSSMPMHDSFTVSGWAKLDGLDKTATVVSQDGDRNSAYALQYQADLKRWVFGSSVSDADGAQPIYAVAADPPVAGQWTHVTGVYDYPAHQLRIYINGQLSGTRSDAVLWTTRGQLVVGRGKANGQATAFFPGAVDEVRAQEGVPTDAEIAGLGGWSAPPAGELGEFANAAGDRYAGPTDYVRDGYHFTTALGLPADPGDNTVMLSACANAGASYTSAAADCEGGTRVGDVGLVYTVPPENIPTIPVYRCKDAAGRFDARGCGAATVDRVLGYSVAYAQLVRYSLAPYDLISTIDGAPPSYRSEGTHGYVRLTAADGLTPIMLCHSGYDYFDSSDPSCGGVTVVGPQGYAWPTAPDRLVSRATYRCSRAERYDSLDASCEGGTVLGPLGYTLVTVPKETAVFPS